MNSSVELTLSKLQELYIAIPEILAVYIFGSVARGDYSVRHSDVDFFIFLNTRNKRIEEKISQQLISIGLENGIRVHPEFQGMMIHKKDQSLIRKIIEEGKVLYATGSFVIQGAALGLRQYVLYSYSLKETSQKSYFSKILHGRNSWYYHKGKKVLKEYHGIIDGIDIIDAGKGALLVAKEKQKDMILVFERFHVAYTIKRIVYG